MKIFKSTFTLLSVVLFSTSVFAQDDIDDVDLSFLSGQTNFNIEYKYDNMMVADKTEEEYKKEKIAKFNEKQPGKGDRWAEKWVNARALTYEPMFEELVNKLIYKANSSAVAAKNQKNAKYSIVVRTLLTDPGFNAVVMKKNPYTNFQIDFVDIATGKIMVSAKFRANGVLFGGSDWDFDPSNSIKECYAKAGKLVGKRMAKYIK